MKQRNTTTTRRIWALLTKEPQLTHRDIMVRLGITSTDTVRRHLGYLEEAGYIRHEYDTKCGYMATKSRQVLIPFIVQECAA